MSPVSDIFFTNVFSLSIGFLFTLLIQEKAALHFNVAQFTTCFLYS